MQLVTRSLDRCPLNERLASSSWRSILLGGKMTVGPHLLVLLFCGYATIQLAESRRRDTVST
ncbi:uncharacterized protein N7484_006566 [Penicillium longicatenatum]|uniref:uncharacterized protein n=1 Tax=Penicillium longicatenatum TaxID=1561947 RepID=UPI002547D527|nr:uncharacterized protein N7484_006566 [Penicillium longicatenatum]KAJ5644059.1 hypothetical protein N7484_006566 [Penicillium longicatenatum]